jgi:hypothetical protein
MTGTVDTTQIVLTDIQNALMSIQTILPSLLNVIGIFYAPAAALAKFLPLIQVALQGVETVAKATGTDLNTATQTVQNHLTPGAPNTPALS